MWTKLKIIFGGLILSFCLITPSLAAREWHSIIQNGGFDDPIDWNYWTRFSVSTSSVFELDSGGTSATPVSMPNLAMTNTDINDMTIISQGFLTSSSIQYTWSADEYAGNATHCYIISDQPDPTLIFTNPDQFHFVDIQTKMWTDASTTNVGKDGTYCNFDRYNNIWQHRTTDDMYSFYGSPYPSSTTYLWLATFNFDGLPYGITRIWDNIDFGYYTQTSSPFATNTSALLDYAVTEHGSAMLWIAGGLLSFAFLAMILRVFAGLKNNV